MTCPKCGLPQPAAEECSRCGVLVRKAHAGPAAPQRPRTPPAPAAPRRKGWLIPLVVLLGPGAFALFVGTRGGQEERRAVPPPSTRRLARPTAAPAETWPAETPQPLPLEPVPDSRPADGPAPTAAAPAEPEGQAPVSGWYDGAAGYRQADEERQRFGKPMAVYFHTDWCGYCRRMESEILSAAETSAYLDRLAKVKVNPEEGGAEAELARRYAVRGFPTFLIVPASGGGGRRVHPFRGGGTMSPAEFVAACRAAE